MAADWLELDSPDPWIRFDSELVCPIEAFSSQTTLLILSPQALKQELVHASYLGIQTVILPAPRNRAHIADYARAINACLSGSGVSAYTHLAVRIPLYIPSKSNLGFGSPRSVTGGMSSPASNASFTSAQSTNATMISDADMNVTWEMWDTIRNLCGYSPRLTLGELLLCTC